MKDKDKSKYKTSIGGQALIEGIMMRGVDKVSVCVRTPDGLIDKESWGLKNNKDNIIFKIPIIRGIFGFAETMILGYKCLVKSAEKSMTEEDTQQESKFEKFLAKKFGDNLVKIFSVIGMVLGLIFSIGLFMFLPTYFVDLASRYLEIDSYRTIIEGVIKIVIFVSYLGIISNMKDVKRVFQYHGGEHKAISCYEAGKELTVENVEKYTRFHPRCGTSFILIVLVISIIAFSFVGWGSVLIRTALKISLLPLIVGIGYEFIKLAGRYDNFLTKIISKPGLWLQRLTTKEPDADQIEVAIEALLMVLPKNKGEDKW